MTTISDVMEFLVEDRAHALPLVALAELFDRMIWTTADNGGGVCEVRDKWLAGDDVVRVEIGLLMDEVFPADSREEMVMLFDRISGKWPRLRVLCDRTLAQWDKQHAPRATS